MESVRDAVAAGAPDPEDAARRLERIEEAGAPLAGKGGDAREVLVLCCQRAPYLAGLLSRDPARLERVAADPYLRREKPADKLRAELDDRLGGLDPDDPDELAARLRRFRADEIVRLGVRELAFGTPAEVGRELSRLADACFDAAIDFHHARLERRYGPARYQTPDGEERPATLSVIAMGKLGGEELNFTSDVDVIYVYSSDAGEAGELSLHEFFSKLCERVTAALGEVTEDGLVFRVDLRLRPEGSRGPIANSLPSMERYYETFGRPWERQAWIKARLCAGDPELGEEVMRTLEPFAFPRHLSPRVVDEVHDLNRRIKAELDRSRLSKGFDLKNGAGGIREVEFFVQALQLIHAGRRPALRTRSTLGALDQLFFAGIVSESERSVLAEAYRFLRHAEHVLQLESGRQTQRLPPGGAALELLARRLGFDGAADFRAELDEHTRGVADLFATLGDEEPGPPPEVLALLEGELSPGEEEERLAGLGFRDPRASARKLDLARKKPASPLGPAATGAGARVAPALLSEIASSPDPDQALHYLSELISRRGTWSAVWRLMDEHPHVLRLIASLFGTSEYLSKQFVGHPELVDQLLGAGTAASRTSPEELSQLFDARLGAVPEGDAEAWWETLAEIKNSQVLRIGIADVAGELDPLEVCEELSQVADECLRRALIFVHANLRERHGVPRDESGAESEIAMLGLGKLGGRELGYASDLDVIFLYRADGESDGSRPLDNVTFMTRLAQRLMGGLHTLHRTGRLYEVDTRLRPSGSQGLLVSSLSAWERYHRGEARLWERQALTKLRPVAGDPALGREVARAAEDYVWGGAPGEGGRAGPEAIGREITGMRDRIERELGGQTRGYDVKVGKGGLIDIEFAAQYLQLLHGHAHPELRTTSTVEALRRAADLGLADPGLCALLVDAYEFLRRLEHRMRIVHDRSVHRLPEDPEALEVLARRVGLADAAALEEAYRRWTTEVRKTYSSLLGPAR